MAKQLIFLVGVLIAFAGCSGRPDESLVAQWDGGALSRVELDHYIVDLPAVDRVVDATDPVSWWTSHAEDAIRHRLLLDGASSEADDGIVAALRNERRRLVTEAEIFQRFGPIDQPGEESLKQKWAELESTFTTPERRRLFSIFRRAGDPISQWAAQKELEKLRRRVLSGESFSDAAEAYSDSESRHQRGFVGIFEPGQLDKRLDEIVFKLPPEIPSEPLTTDDGVHLFLVQSVFPERTMTFEESRSDLVRHLQAEESWNRLEETAQALWTPLESDVILEAEELTRTLRQEADETILRVGDFRMSKSQWVRWAKSNLDELDKTGKLVLGYLTLAKQEMVLQGVEATAGVNTEILATLKVVEDRLKAESRLELEIRKIVDEEEILSYFSTNSRRFATAPRSHFRRLEVSFDDSPVAVMSRLEESREALDRGQLSLGELALELGGEIDDLGWLSGRELVRVLPTASTSVLSLNAGEHGYPFSTGHSLVVLEVVATEPQHVPLLDEVRPQVTARYIAEERPRLLKRVKEAMLSDAGVEFEESWLESLGQTTGFSSDS